MFAVRVRRICAILAAIGWPGLALAGPIWPDYAGDAQHSADSSIPSQPLQSIHWSTPVDLDPQYFDGELLIHYGSPLVTQANSIIVPVKTGPLGGFELSAFNGTSGVFQWQASTDYVLPPHNWVPSYSPALTPSGRLYYPGAGGTVYWRDVASQTPGRVTQLAFYGLSNYQAAPTAYNQNVFIDTPLTADAAGNVYFGFQTTLPVNGLQSGIARIAPDGAATWVPATSGTPIPGQMAMNCAPALSRDGKTLYIAATENQASYLLALDSSTLAVKSRVALIDPISHQPAFVLSDSTASPTIGPDGDVYYGVMEDPFGQNHSRGWLMHFSADLSSAKPVGAFGWDDTASVVPASMVKSYRGPSSYLLMTKYNDYGEAGGSGVNRLAILDPNATQIDPITGQAVMKEVLTIASPTPDPDFPPLGVKEWCINTAAVDPATGSILVNNEDGVLYRWDLSSNSLSESLRLTDGLGEAYTPTVIAGDGTVLAISNARLFAVGVVPEPGAMLLLCTGALLLARRRNGLRATAQV